MLDRKLVTRAEAARPSHNGRWRKEFSEHSGKRGTARVVSAIPERQSVVSDSLNSAELTQLPSLWFSFLGQQL